MKDPVARKSGRAVFLIPLIVFLGLCGLFFIRLGAGDPTNIPSALIGKPSPVFSLPALEGSDVAGLDAYSLRTGEPTFVNIFASWCIPCRQEAPALMALKARGIRIVGIAYKDDPANALKFLQQSGNPFAAIGVDRAGRATIDLGVHGVPETFLLDRDGIIVQKFIGALSAEAAERAIQELNRHEQGRR